MTTKHTPGPWTLGYKGAGGWVFIHPQFGYMDARSIGMDKAAAHATLNVLNAHDELVAALREAIAAVERSNLRHSRFDCERNQYDNVMATGRAALAKAKS